MDHSLFALEYHGAPFVHGGPAHLIAIALVLLTCVGCWWVFRDGRNPAWRTPARYALAGWLVVNQIAWYGWVISTGGWTLRDSLPLHLCLVSALLCVALLLTERYRLYEVLYFWGLAGGAHALLTPDLTIYGFPHIRFVLFFTVHGALLVTAVLITVVANYRPTWRSFGRFVLITNGYMLFVGLVNWLTGGNYMYLAHTPEFPSLIDQLGPWPWYILSLELIGVVSALLCYLPWALRDRAGRVSSR